MQTGHDALRSRPGTVMAATRPIFLLADSQPLFWRGNGEPFVRRLAAELPAEAWSEGPRAAYLGASNEDRPEFFELFQAAMETAHIRDCRMVRATADEEGRAFLREAHLVLLAGGDVHRGWRAFERSGLVEALPERYHAGAVIAGVSAGAVQLGLGTADPSGNAFVSTFGLVPLVVGAHGEPGWDDLRRLAQQARSFGRAIGIPTGGGAIYHPDHTVEPVRHGVKELIRGEDGISESVLLPPASDETQSSTLH